MTLQDLITRAQTTANDLVGSDTSRLWSVAEWTDYANEAVNVLNEELLLITDAETASICVINVLANTRSYAYDPRILQFDEVRYTVNGVPRVLTPSNVKEFYRYSSSWRTDTGVPDAFALDDTSGKLTLNRIPTANATINMSVKRSPLNDLVSTTLSGEPEIKRQYHRRLLNYMLFKAYSKQDAEVIDPAKAKRHFELYREDVNAIILAENNLRQGTHDKYRSHF